jgi:hypothetical protein
MSGRVRKSAAEPQEIPFLDPTVEEGSKFVLHTGRHGMFPFLLTSKECRQFRGDEAVENGFF